MESFPPADTEEQYEALTEGRLRVPVERLCRELGLYASPVRFADGSLPVYAVGDRHVLKLYPPAFAGEAKVESTALRAVQGKLPIPTPAPERVGEADGWEYLLMRRLTGVSLANVWPRLSVVDKQELAPRLGETLAALHRVTDPALADLEPRDWPGFIAAQRASAVDRQRAAGLREEWLEQIPCFLDSVDDAELGKPEPVLLHTEFMREHLLMTEGGTGWTVSGLFDFEPAMVGAPEYELVAVGLFVSCGDADFLRALLLGYGYSADRLGERLSRRLLAYTLLHRYANLPWFLSRLPAPPEPTLDALATTWFGTGSGVS
ncbi:phosphotransferase family protein [Amycolatopsis cihanbeyliensis]|uniref:Hygromycin-B 7''-O-kinase n=1 Tax=Amycolatopsis cihanbeyliensis TaxID=1128664 RepID=A0A542CUS0_AMYCI|nr:aminoglycoside 3'-phosphotransferase/choline kinase family protein [Amycolatopsis cihanbeyliensis]TQI94563.1 hygromycin-B 7''-O-kinase [Amycolatopsis cihanbeyliensis]